MQGVYDRLDGPAAEVSGAKAVDMSLCLQSIGAVRSREPSEDTLDLARCAWMLERQRLTQRHQVGYNPLMANTTRTSRLLSPRDAAKVLGISYPTLKQWIYKKKLHTVTTAGGHHRIPESELDQFLHLHSERLPVEQRRPSFRQISGRNQLAGRVTEIQIDALMAQVTLSIGGQRITSIITSDAVREMRLRVGDKAAALIKSTEVMLVRL